MSIALEHTFEALNLENHHVEIVLELELLIFVVEFDACNSKSDM